MHSTVVLSPVNSVTSSMKGGFACRAARREMSVFSSVSSFMSVLQFMA